MCFGTVVIIIHCNFNRNWTINKLIVRLATPDDKHYAETITLEMEESAKARGTGIAKRSPEYIEAKMKEGKAVIAITQMAPGLDSVISKRGNMVSMLPTPALLLRLLSVKQA